MAINQCLNIYKKIICKKINLIKFNSNKVILYNYELKTLIKQLANYKEQIYF